MTTCENCDASLDAKATICPDCGESVRPARGARGGIAAALLFLAAAVGGAVYVATRPEPLIQAGPTPDATAPPVAMTPAPAASAATDLQARLNSAMQSCDEAAAADRGSLHLLVIPLQTDAKNLADWKTLAINRIGQATVVSRDDMMAGLRAGTLSLSDASYGLTLRDDRAPTEQRWDQKSGVTALSLLDKGEITVFRLQFVASHTTGTSSEPNAAKAQDFGARIARQPAQCHWINVIPDP